MARYRVSWQTMTTHSAILELPDDTNPLILTPRELIGEANDNGKQRKSVTLNADDNLIEVAQVHLDGSVSPL